MQRQAAVFLILLMMLPSVALASSALCFNCGELHSGPLSACDKCGFQPDIENSTLWTTFSDRFMTPQMLTHFGKVMQLIAAATPDFEERLWVFFQHLIENYPEMGIIDPSSLQIPDKYRESVPRLIKELKLPTLDLRSIPRR